ncbi:MAG: AarF/ABC1/UbiB kinase family protein [Rivularia sp. ALOHA_DT_140]|nr:AarF/ABC1/UbiB kinase family protein [Rivularia sp. ALOHA_DT_140]
MNMKTVPPNSTPQETKLVLVDNNLDTAAVEFPTSIKRRKSSLLEETTSEHLGLRYDALGIAAHYRKRPLQVWGRIFAVLAPVVSFAVGVWWDSKLGKKFKNDPRRAVQLRELLTKLGPAYIKIGQALSTRPDLVPPVYLEELTQLQDKLPPFSNELAYQFIEEEVGAKPEDIYTDLTPDPIAAASLGQVYKARLKATGEEVAVKVQRPDLREKITIDLYILRRVAAWAQKAIKQVRSDLVGILDELGERVFEEMDYVNEGENAERFFQLYGHLKDVYVPKIYWEYTNRRVLTMEWINGLKLTQVKEIAALGIDARYLVEVGVQCSLRQLLEHGFFHADPHPGNLLATYDGKLAYLDFGMMSEIRPPQRYGLIEAIVHVVNRDFDALASDYVKLDFLTEDVDLSPIIPAFAEVFADAQGASVADLNIKTITDDLSALMYEYPFRVPPYYALIIRSLVTLEGVAIYIDPNFKVLSEAYPYVSKRLLTDPSPELRASLRDLLFKDGRFRWNRLENLLKNARNSQDYDSSDALDKGLEFLASERGAFIRTKLVDELFKGIDALGRNFMHNFTHLLRERVGVTTITEVPGASSEEKETLEHIKNIIKILQEGGNLDIAKAIEQISKLAVNPNAQLLGQKITSQIAQKTLARVLRELLVTEEVENKQLPQGS